MAITRTIIIDVTVTIICCRDGVEAYVPSPQKFHKTLTITKDVFIESLIVWRDRIIQSYENYLWNLADDECLQVGTRRLCAFNADWSRTAVEESIVPEIIEPVKLKEIPADVLASIERLEAMKRRQPPKPITEQIEYLEEQKEQEETKSRKDSIQKAIDRLKAKYIISEESKEKIQEEIDSLKEKYGIE